MRTHFLMLALLTAVLSVDVASAEDQAVDVKAVRGAIKRSLPYLATEGENWMKKRKCVSCHHTAYLVWTHRAAQSHGFEISQEKLEEWTQWCLDKSLEEHKMGGKTAARNLEGVGQLILTHAGSPIPPTQTTAFETFSQLIAEGRQPSGLWKAGGQLPLQNRSKDENNAISSIWALLALAQTEDALSDEAQEKTLAALGQFQEAKSNEWWVAWLLLEMSYGKPAQVQQRVAELLIRQRTDGGWSWLTGEKSDALATGQSLYAIRIAGVGKNDPEVQKAISYLLTTQQEEGNWLVPTTVKRKWGKAIPTSNFLGTAWATLGLLELLDE